MTPSPAGPSAPSSPWSSPLRRGRAGPLPPRTTEASAIMSGMPRRVSSPVFVGRADALGRLEHALARGADGTPAVVFVAGESGVGKSRLIAEFESRARARGEDDVAPSVLVGHCLELGGSEFAYAPLVEALRPIARDLAECRTEFPELSP